ncbi:MAG: hypothetical protein IKA56_00685 [Clostridia bacterium]|nr:hypothetical protein [Clostridia bacterium]
MKKALAIILSVIMLLGAMPFASFAAEPVYDRAEIAAENEAYIDGMSAEQIASLILDWVDREVAKYSEDIKAAVVEGVVENGFEGFELAAFGDVIAAQIPDIASLDDIIAYKDYLKELGGDFANLDAAKLVTRAEAGSAIGFVNGVFEFMAANSDIFGKVFRWDDNVFDYGKVGEYIETFKDSENADEQAIYEFYINYLLGNDIQGKFTKWVADQMNYTIPEGEAFDDTLNNGILGWFVGLCETNGILSADAIAELKKYDLRTTDVYTLIKNFVALAEADNEVEIDTYYNYIMDTVVRTMLKTMLGQKAVVGAAASLPASFAETYKDYALLAQISGGTVYYKDGDNYYEVAVTAEGATAKAVTWESVVDFEFPTVTIYTGANCDQEVQVYHPVSKDAVAITTYASAKNQSLVSSANVDFEFTGTEVPAEFKALMTEANAKALSDSFGVAVKQGDEVIAKLELAFKDIEEMAETKALPIAQKALADAIAAASLPIQVDVTIEAIDVVLGYNGWSTEDEFICEVVVDSVSVKLGGAMASMVQGMADSAAKTAVGTYIDSPVATVVVDGISGGTGVDASGAKELYEFIDTDFAVDQGLLDFTANYDKYNGVVGQANRVLYDLVDMLVSDAGMEKLALTEGNNDNFTANLEKICATAEDMMASAEAIMTDPEINGLLGDIGLDMDSLLAGMDLDLLYAVDFSSVEALWVSVITLGLDIIDTGDNALIAEIHALIGDLANLDAMAVAVADYALGECVPALNTALADAGLDFALTVPAKTDAKAVADGAGKDIIMTKAVDLIYEAAVEGVALVNSIANEALAALATETGIEMPTVAFELDVAKGNSWQATLTALVDRAYELLDGIVIACDNEYTDTIDKISAVANAILPLGSLVSNCASDNFAFDGNKVMGFLFDDGLEGDLDGFLRLFETKEKTEDVAAGCSVTEALINASDHIVDSIFPDTVEAQLYVNATSEKFTETTVQEYFTSAENDQAIASRNMKSINARKAELVPAALNLVREAGVLPFFAKCDQDHTAADLETVTVPGKAATCTEAGVEDAVKCAECGYVVSGGNEIPATDHDYESKVTTAPTCDKEGVRTYTCKNDATHVYTEKIAATGHSYGAWEVTKAPTCAETGVETRTCHCGDIETRDIAKTAHVDSDSDNECDNCGKEIDSSFGAKIKAFFQKIINWFKNLFK